MAICVSCNLGFEHTAYNLHNEAHLDHSPNINVSLPRGELIALLRKALLFQESEEAFHNKVPYPALATWLCCNATHTYLNAFLAQGKSKEGPLTLLGRYRTTADGPVPDGSAPTVKHRSDVNAAAPAGSSPHTPNANGVNSAAIKKTEEDDSGRPKKRVRTDDTDDEVVEGISNFI